MAVAGKHELDVQALAGRVRLGLLQSVRGRLVFRLGFDQRHGHRLRIRSDFDPQHIVHAPLGLLARLAVDDLDRAGGLLAPNQILGPAARVESGVDQFGAGIRLA